MQQRAGVVGCHDLILASCLSRGKVVGLTLTWSDISWSPSKTRSSPSINTQSCLGGLWAFFFFLIHFHFLLHSSAFDWLWHWKVLRLHRSPIFSLLADVKSLGYRGTILATKHDINRSNPKEVHMEAPFSMLPPLLVKSVPFTLCFVLSFNFMFYLSFMSN